MYELFWELGQQSSIASASDAATSAQLQAESASARVTYLQSENQRLLLLVRALWEIVQEQHGLSDEVLAKKVQEVDLRDGVLDGKYAKQIRTCEACGRVMNLKHKHCLYCGARPAQGDVIGG